MIEPLRQIRIDGLLAPTHDLRRAVTAYRIYATDEIGTHSRVTVIADGEPAYVTVPGDFCLSDTPVTGDWLVVFRNGDICHMRDDVFLADAVPVPRANAGALERPRIPRFPG